jgi:peptidyl-prolyl cis-trans isomerase-like protein 2
LTLPLSYQDPFEDYKKRLAKKLAKRAEQNNTGSQKTEEAKKDEINWFGVKIGSESAGSNLGGSSNDGVGRYLNLKRTLDTAVKPTDDSKKKRKIGFGDFEGW